MNKLYLDGQKQVKNVLGFRLAVCFLCFVGVVWPYGHGRSKEELT